MSNQRHHCKKCERASDCEVITPFPQGQEEIFAVSWKCPGCGERALVVSPIGPLLAPARDACLQCGHLLERRDQRCPSCGNLLSEVLSEQEQSQPESRLLEMARDDFAAGTCRRGVTIVNLVLQRNPRSSEAWSIKGQFLEHLGFQAALKAAMAEAVRQSQGAAPHLGVSADKRWWQFWK